MWGDSPGTPYRKKLGGGDALWHVGHGVAHMGPHLPRSLACLLFGITFWGAPGGCLGSWPAPLERQKSLTLIGKIEFLGFYPGIQCWSVIGFAEVLDFFGPLLVFFSWGGCPPCLGCAPQP